MKVKTLTINDPIHGIMELEDLPFISIRSIIGHPLFTRLRHIKQLGLADLVFPGGVHTRFIHSIGAAHLAKRILYRVQPNASTEMFGYVVLATLLHDIGHGPFSHAFEKLTQKPEIELITHEAWTDYFIKEIVHSLPIEVLNLISALITKSSTIPKEYQLIADIISSQLDADRLDYLLRDSYFCGVTYGKYDINWLLHCMQAIPDECSRLRLGVSKRGVGAVEDFFMARRLMTHNVYHNQTVNLLQLLTMHFLDICCNFIYDAAVQNLCPPILKKFLEGLFLYQTKQIPKHAFMSVYFASYQRLSDPMIFQWIEIVAFYPGHLPENLKTLGKRIYLRHLPKVFYVPKENIAPITTALTQLKHEYNYPIWQLGIEVNKFMTYSSHQGPILVQDKKVVPITEESLFMKAMMDKQESSHYVYIDKELLNSQHIKNFIRDFLYTNQDY